MEATVLSVGKSVLNGALGVAKSTLAEEVALQLGVERDHAFIRDELEMMRSFLMLAHDERGNSSVVTETWVKQVRDVAYDVEDNLQDFAIRVGKKSSWWRNPRMLQERRRIAKKMKELRAKVEDVSQRNMRYQLIKAESGSKPTAAWQPSNTGSAVMSGTQEAWMQQQQARARLIRLVDDKVKDLRVISVWRACSDLGTKEPIIRGAYDYLSRKEKIKCSAWIDMARMLIADPIELLQTIAKEFYISSFQKTSERTAAECQDLRRLAMTEKKDLPDTFKGYVKDKCYLIMLNGLSTIELWEKVKEYFPDNKEGSRVIVCTQEVQVASVCVGTKDVAPEHLQLSADNTLYAIFCKGSEEGIGSEQTPSQNEITICRDNSGGGIKNLVRAPTMAAAFKESELIGRENEKKTIRELIAKGGQQLETISIWGMGGIGKTTLVKDVYRSQEINGMFDKLACVTIMRPFNRFELLRSLFDQLKDSTTSEALTDSTEVQREIQKLLQGKKYLVVLDDLLFQTEWDAIVSVFPPSERESRIVVTTREKPIAMHCSGDQEAKIYELSGLAEEHANELFTKKVFGEPINLDEQFPELAEEGKLILKRCNRLPLAIVTMGGFLAKQPKTTSEWKRLNDQISSPLEINLELKTIRSVLGKSYDGLPYHLKSCFLYLSIFPEDHKIRRKRLVRRWAAEGYLGEMADIPGKEIAADINFCELIERSMIQPTNNKESANSSKGADSCLVHDLMRDIAILKAKEENLVLRLEGAHRLNSQSTWRHLAITNTSSRIWEGDEDEFESAVDLYRIRSLTVFGECKPFFISDKMRFLRVLDLEDSWINNHHLKHIGKLLHLQHLSLRCCGGIDHLPESLGNLKQLETLDFRSTRISNLPRSIVNLRKLNYVRGGNLHGSVVAPRGLRSMKSLHTLAEVNIAQGRTVVRDLERLTQLRKLGVDGVSKKNCQELCSALTALTRLESLKLQSEWRSSLEGCLDGDDKFSLPKGLKSLKLHLCLVELPRWTQRLENLEKLKLWGTFLKDHAAAIQALGQLPKLTILCLHWTSFDDGTMELHFPEGSLRNVLVLDLGLFPGLKEVKVGKGAMSNLELMLLSGLVLIEGELKFEKIAGLESLPRIKEFRLTAEPVEPQGKDLYLHLDDSNLDELRVNLRAQLSQNPNEPIIELNKYSR